MAVDADDVTFPLKNPYDAYLKKRFGDIELAQDHYHLGKEFNFDWQKEAEIYYEYTQTEEYLNLEPLPGAVEGILRLKEFTDLVVITS